MIIKISDQITKEGNFYYEWDLWDGPDGIDHVHGYATDLVQAFSKIFEWRERISRDYAPDTNTENETD